MVLQILLYIKNKGYQLDICFASGLGQTLNTPTACLFNQGMQTSRGKIKRSEAMKQHPTDMHRNNS